MPEKLATVHRTICAGLSTRERRTFWTDGLAGLLPDRTGPDGIHSEKTAQRFLEVCEHLDEHAVTREQQQHLIRGMVDAQQRIPWSDPLFFQVDELLVGLIDTLYDDLGAELARTEDPETSVRLYEQLRDHCFGLDDGIVRLAIANPHISGRRIMLDFAETVFETGPDGLVEKLEAEGEHEYLDLVVECDPATSADLVRSLADPDRYIEGMLERRAARREELPDWVWYSDILIERFDLLRSKVSWDEISACGAGPMWQRIELHLEQELGEDTEAWETFHALEEGFDGTLDELVNAARNL